MDISTQNTRSYLENEQFLSDLYTSEKQFVTRYKKLYKRKIKAKELYFQILTELHKTISVGNVDRSRNLTNIICYISSIENKETIRTYYNDKNNPIKNTNLVILSCKYNKVEILNYIFDNNKILNNMTINVEKDVIAPNDNDDTSHNAFYYAVRSTNVDLLDTLINKWPGNYFVKHSEELDEILSQAYEELKIKNVPLSNKMEIFVQDKLIDLRFFSKSSERFQNVKTSLSNVKLRIELVLENISLLNSNTEVDDKFLYVTKFITQNIHILKRQLKSTYDRLPWEEIEFCLVCFVSSYIKEQEINLFYRVTMNKDKILKHLENFANKLKEEKECLDISKPANPNLKREDIVRNYPQFEELYNDFQQIRDIYALNKIENNLTLALSSNPKEKEGQLIITRTLQVIGEFLKNTLESPNLSITTTELLLQSLPRNTRKVIIDLRNSLSHAESLFKRTEIEEKSSVSYFTGIQNDIKKINSVINDIFYKYKIKMIKILLKKVINSKNLGEMKHVAEVFNNVEREKFRSVPSTIMEHKKIETLIEELSSIITDKTSYEEDLFANIRNVIKNISSFENTTSANKTFDYMKGFESLKDLKILLDNNIDDNGINGIKTSANRTLDDMTSDIEPHCLQEIVELIFKIFNSIQSRKQYDNIDKIEQLSYEVLHIAEFGVDNIKWIEQLREKLKEKESSIPERKQNKIYRVTKEKYNKQLTLKLNELKNILSKNALNNQSTEIFPSYKNNEKLQAVVEMLVLDIMSIFGSSNDYLTNNLYFIDDNTPLLNGKCLRNHLAHYNALLDVLSFDPSIAIIVNAKKLSVENIMENKIKIGKLVRDDPSKLKYKCDQGIDTLTNQKKMFLALEDGHLEDTKSCIKNGADIHARSFNLWTTLHSAAKGSSLEIINFIIDQNLDVNVKDINGQSPLHIAAAYGRKSIVEFFIDEKGISVGIVDNNGDTPLHIAAKKGHKDIVTYLLEKKSNTLTKNKYGLSPLHYAIRNNHNDVAKVILKKDANVDVNETVGGFTPLHEAAKNGNLELVNFLLQNKANVHSKTDSDWTPLHAAALHGHLEILNALISKGADVNSIVITGCTPLHYAVECGHENIVDVLLKHNVNVNVADKTYKYTPLHYAAKDGHEGIVKKLLKRKANANAANVEGRTPLLLAVQYGHLGIIITLLENGVDINTKNKIVTPLHCAVESGYTEITDFLIKNKAEINFKAKNNLAPLHVAALRGHKDITDLLIKNKAEINIRADNDLTPLHIAAVKGHAYIIDVLLKNKAEVNAKSNTGFMPLHSAAESSCVDAIVCLLNNNAEVNAKTDCGLTPLLIAVMKGHKDVVNLLIKNKAQVNPKNNADRTPLGLAVETGNKEVVEILIENGADLNAKKNKSLSPLSTAVKQNNKQIVELLVSKKANVDVDDGKPLLFAVVYGIKDIVKILLKNGASININCSEMENTTLLHIAARIGHKGIVDALIRKGADVNANNIHNETPLYFAAKEGHEEVVEHLVLKGANINIKNIEGPLHIAAANGYNSIVEVLLNNGADMNIKDNRNRTSAEMAIAHGHLQVVRTLLQQKNLDINAKGNDGWTMLHIAAQAGNLEITKCLVEQGADIYARNSSGSKPIHIAAREGFKNIVEFYLNRGIIIYDFGASFDTLLHYAAIRGQLEVAEYLIEKGIDVNIINVKLQTPMHTAAGNGCRDIMDVLLKNGAYYNHVDIHSKRPLELATDKEIINLLTSTDKLFDAVKHNSLSEVKNCIKVGAYINAKYTKNGTPLHYAAWKGYHEIVDILLQNKGNPNVVDSNGFTPLHYAVKYSHFQIVMALLMNGAIYDAISNTDKTPENLAVDESITSLLKLVSESFKNIKNGDSKVINDLRKTDIDTVKAVMNACNRENKTLVVTAIHNDFPQVEQLKEILQDDVFFQIGIADALFRREEFQEALNIYRTLLEKRRKILRQENPGTLDIQKKIANILYKKQNYHEALRMYEEIYQKQTELLGKNNIESLNTRSNIALVLHRLGKNEEALNIFKEILPKQKEIQGENHFDVLITQGHMALVLDSLKKYEEALSINYELFEKHKKISGINGPATLIVKKNIAMVLSNQCKYDEALKMYEEVYESRRKILVPGHSDTLRTLHDIATVLVQQEKFDEALKKYNTIFDIQKAILGPSHIDTLQTQYNIANLLYEQGKYIGAFKNYMESFEQRKAILGQEHPHIMDTVLKIQILHLKFEFKGSSVSEILLHLQKEINTAANSGDTQTVERLLKEGVDANDKDVDGRTPIHYAVDNGDIGIVNILLKNGADATQVTNKGNTPLHTATAKGFKEIVEILLENISRNRLNDFINTQTTDKGTTALHVAAKNGFLEIVKLLLNYGATYNIANKERQTPLDLSKDQNIINLLKLTEELFEDAENGNKYRSCQQAESNKS